jgi:Flp pilus assembly protein TadD
MRAKLLIILISTLAVIVVTACTSQPQKDDSLSFDEDRDSSKELVSEPGQVAPPSKPADTRVQRLELAKAIQSQNDEAILASAQKVLSQNPKDSYALNALGVLRLKKGQTKAARFFFEQGVSADPANSSLLNNLGLTDLREGEVDTAVLHLKKAVKADSRHWESLANLGAIYLKYGDHARAYSLLKDIPVKNAPAKVLNNMGVAARMSGKFSEAEKFYEIAYKLEPQNTSVLLNYSILLVDFLKKPSVAKPILNKLSFVGSDDVQVQSRVVELEKKLNQPAQQQGAGE